MDALFRDNPDATNGTSHADRFRITREYLHSEPAR